jgi:2-iminobutanoate/2-iminopropanoate deaminase
VGTGVLAGKKLYIAGQIDRDPKTGEQPDGTAAQTRMAMDNMGRFLRVAGMDYGNELTCHAQLADIDNYKGLNEVYGSYFGPDHYPSRTTVEMPGLPSGATLDVTCVAFGDKSLIKIVMPLEGRSRGPWEP